MAIVFKQTFVQRFYGIVKSRCRKRFFRSNPEPVTGRIQNVPPPDVALGAILLGTDIRIKLFVYAL